MGGCGGGDSPRDSDIPRPGATYHGQVRHTTANGPKNQSATYHGKPGPVETAEIAIGKISLSLRSFTGQHRFLGRAMSSFFDSIFFRASAPIIVGRSGASCPIIKILFFSRFSQGRKMFNRIPIWSAILYAKKQHIYAHRTKFSTNTFVWPSRQEHYANTPNNEPN